MVFKILFRYYYYYSQVWNIGILYCIQYFNEQQLLHAISYNDNPTII